jgi:hypothetical protein
MDSLLHLYRERCGHPGFWAEPVNALTNASFLIAAVAAWRLAVQRGALTEETWVLVVLAAAIGCDSFLFHTLVNGWTMWLDMVPIALFQVAFLWLAGRSMLSLSVAQTTFIVAAVLGLSFAAMPLHRPLNGSLFYLPALLALAAYGTVALLKSRPEPWLLPAAACAFSLAIVARSLDLKVPFALGTHFLWHLLNGFVLYLAMRAWVLHTAAARDAV